MGTFSFGDEYPLVPGPQKKPGSLLQLLVTASQLVMEKASVHPCLVSKASEHVLHSKHANITIKINGFIVTHMARHTY